MSGTNITYNGIQFLDVLTKDINQEVVYDSTGVDPVYVKVIVEADVTILTSTGSLGYGVNDNLASVISTVQSAIMTPRRNFIMSVNGTDLFNVKPAATAPGAAPNNGGIGQGVALGKTKGGTDINHGPKASLVIHHIVGDKVARGTLRVELAIANCGAQTINANYGVVNLRFWAADEVDENWYTTRTFHGRLRVASKNVSVHELRELVFPPVASGFKRKSVSLQEDPNGLELEFTIVDEEFPVSCPKPATTWKGTHNASTPFIGGVIGESEVRVTLEGPRDTSKAKLISLAVNIIDSKLHIKTSTGTGAGSLATSVLLYYAISDSLHENRITATAKIRHATALTKSGGNIFSKSIGQPLELESEYDHNRARQWGPPTAGLSGLFIQLLQTSCNPSSGFRGQTGTSIKKSSGKEKPVDPGEEPGDTYELSGEIAPLNPHEVKYSEKQDEHIYSNHYRMSSEFIVNQGTVGLPVGSTSSSSGTSLAVVSLHKPVARKVIRVVAERVGAAPDIPKPRTSFVSGNITHTLKEWDLTGGAVALSADGRTEIFHVEASIEYWMSKAPTPGVDSFEIGRIPSLDDVSTTLPANIFTTDLGI